MKPPMQLEARVAFTCILAVFVGAIIAEARLTQDNNRPVLIWLAYAVVCGMVLRDGRDSEWRVLLASAVSPTAFAATVGFITLQRGHVWITGRKLAAADPEMVALIVGMLWVVSYVGIWVFSFAHQYLLWLIKTFLHLSDEVLARVDKRLKWIVGIIATLGLIAEKIF